MPQHMQDELTENYRDMIYDDTAADIETQRTALLRASRLKSRTVADCLAEAGDRLFTSPSSTNRNGNPTGSRTLSRG